MRKYTVKLLQKNADPNKSLWRILYGKRAKDFKGKEVYMPDDYEDLTLGDLKDQKRSLTKNFDRVHDLIKAIEKEKPDVLSRHD